MLAVTETLKGRHFTRVSDWSRSELEQLLDLADELKAVQQGREEHHLLAGRSIGLIFAKPSARTRVSFGVGIAQLGGFPLFLSDDEIQFGRRETIKDSAYVLSRYLDAIVIRTFAQSDVDSTSPKFVSVECPLFKTAIGGGATILGEDIEANPTPLALLSSTPLVPLIDFENGEAALADNWAASAQEVTETDADWGISVYVVCADVDGHEIP